MHVGRPRCSRVAKTIAFALWNRHYPLRKELVLSESVADGWARWLRHGRHGDDSEQLQAQLEKLYPVRERILQNAGVSEGDVVLDVGAGTGFIAFEALNRVGKQGKVIFCDASQQLLDGCRALAEKMGALDRSEFVHASADELTGIGDSSVDVITTRAVVMYVPAKDRVFREFHRVLCPGGRVSMYERINSFGYPEPPHLFWGMDVAEIQHISVKVRALLEPPEHAVLLSFDERDLMRHAVTAGFHEVHLELHAKVTPREPVEWAVLKRLALPPPSMSLEEAIDRALTPQEAERFVAHVRPLVESGTGAGPWAAAYLWAVKH